MFTIDELISILNKVDTDEFGFEMNTYRVDKETNSVIVNNTVVSTFLDENWVMHDLVSKIQGIV